MRSKLALVFLVASARVAHAGDPKFEYGAPDEVKEVKNVEWHATAEAGLVLTTGNSETTSATGGIKVSRKQHENKISFEASGAYAKSAIRVLLDKNGNGLIDNAGEITTEDTVMTEQIASKLRYDRFLTELNSVFVAGLAARDLPAGKESVYGVQVGYSRNIHKTKTSESVAEIGYDFSREDLTAGPPVAIHSGRLFVGHKAAMAPGTDVDMSLELLTNFNRETLPTGKDGGPLNDTRATFKIGISAKIGKSLAVQTSIEAHFDNRPGPLTVKNLAMGYVPEASKVDTIMKAALIYTFAGTK
jgi:hypothetical protein